MTKVSKYAIFAFTPFNYFEAILSFAAIPGGTDLVQTKCQKGPRTDASVQINQHVA